MPPLFAGKTIVTDQPRICGIPGIIVYIITDCTAGVVVTADAVVSSRVLAVEGRLNRALGVVAASHSRSKGELRTTRCDR